LSWAVATQIARTNEMTIRPTTRTNFRGVFLIAQRFPNVKIDGVLWQAAGRPLQNRVDPTALDASRNRAGGRTRAIDGDGRQ
jgi:hypothetical protein